MHTYIDFDDDNKQQQESFVLGSESEAIEETTKKKNQPTFKVLENVENYLFRFNLCVHYIKHNNAAIKLINRTQKFCDTKRKCETDVE